MQGFLLVVRGVVQLHTGLLEQTFSWFLDEGAFGNLSPRLLYFDIHSFCTLFVVLSMDDGLCHFRSV